MKFEILDVSSQKQLWIDTLKKCKRYDFYHTATYHTIEEDTHTSQLFIASDDTQIIALPLIIRTIEGSEFKDATSVYGYAGPVASVDFDQLNPAFISFFKDQLKNYFTSEGIISVFSRLHPLIETNNFFNDLGEEVLLNKTVSIDITLEIDEQRRKYRKSNKYEINQLKKKGFEVVEASSDQDINAFITIYTENMERVNATENYFFSKEYFYSFLKNEEFKNVLLLAKKDDVIVAGAIFTICNDIMQYHLAGTSEAFLKETPMKLILDEARLVANKLDLKYLHLGGGIGGTDTDGLFRFKSGFSDNFFRFSVWKYIHSQDNYKKLSEAVGADTDSSFFPLYRSVSNNL